MGSKSDWPIMKHAADVLDKLKIKYETQVVSAHRTPDLLYKYASSAESRGIEVIIAGAGGSAHLPGMTSSKTTLPVIGVPIKTKNLDGVAASILSNKYPVIKQQLKKYRSRQTRSVLDIGDPRK